MVVSAPVQIRQSHLERMKLNSPLDHLRESKSDMRSYVRRANPSIAASESDEEWADARETTYIELQEGRGKEVSDVRDPDLTPRPLKITKRIDSCTLGTPVRDKAHVLRRSQTQATLVPHRRPSSQTTIVELDLSKRRSSSPTSPWSRRHTFLNVRKQRSCKPNILPSAADKIHRDSVTHPETSDSAALVHSDRTRKLSQPQIYRRAALSVLKNETDRSLPSIEDSGPSGLDGPARKGSGRTTSNKQPTLHSSHANMEDSSHPQSPEDESISAKKPPRQPSFKHRFLNRMMIGLPTRSISDSFHDASTKPDGSHTERVSAGPWQDQHSSISTTTTDMDSNLDKTIASFPTPPQSVLTSPTTVSSFKSTDTQRQRDSTSYETDELPVIGAELSAYSGTKSGETCSNVQVAVDIAAIISPEESYRVMDSETGSLDVAFIVDNSLHNSPAALMSSCETVKKIASLMDPDVDRVAVYALDVGESLTPNVALPLGRIRMNKVKKSLDSITNSLADFEEGAMRMLINLAENSLLQPQDPLWSKETSLRHVSRHLFVLTADPRPLRRLQLSHRSITTHLLQQGFPKSDAWDTISSNGWKIDCSAYMWQSVTDSIEAALLNAKFETLVQLARTGYRPAALQDLHIELRPGQRYDIKEPCVKLDFPRLQAGEMRTLLIELEENESSMASNESLSPISFFDTSSANEDLVSELEMTFALANGDAIQIDLTYRHPLLPRGTTCHMTDRHNLHKNNRSQQNPRRSGISGSWGDKATSDRAILERAQALQISSLEDSQDALTKLQSEFGNDVSQYTDAHFIRALTQEVKYRARLANRRSIQNSPLKPRHTSRSSLSIQSSEHKQPGNKENENTQPHGWITIPDKEKGQPAKYVNLTDQLGLDNASKIWTKIRDESGGQFDSSTHQNFVNRTWDDGWTRIGRDQATRSGIESSGVRSFTDPTRNYDHGMRTTWL